MTAVLCAWHRGVVVKVLVKRSQPQVRLPVFPLHVMTALVAHNDDDNDDEIAYYSVC